jgi:photosystem II stability/assembly factor-like uncharacterized protein
MDHGASFVPVSDDQVDVAVGAGPRVLETTDFGATWSEASSGLPNMPVNSIYIRSSERQCRLRRY